MGSDGFFGFAFLVDEIFFFVAFRLVVFEVVIVSLRGIDLHVLYTFPLS